MVTFLDAGLVSGFSAIFAFLLFYVLIYGVLIASGIAKLGKGIAAIIAVSIAFLGLFSPRAVLVVQMVIPWYLVLFVIMFFIMLAMMFSGVKFEGDMGKKFVGPFLVIMLVIFFAGLGQAFFGEGLVDSEGEAIERPFFLDRLISPEVLGVIIFLVLVVVVILAMGAS
ncbi:MAG: hypothetical protein ACMXYK_03745 [Candidatus Woesearchaeota archaeon]